ncbi:MAG TPA: ATP-binding protein [Tepidisphaeraceae bacterium]|jgi:signal transduction histidine kinase/CheY-like chemotaxis protein
MAKRSRALLPRAFKRLLIAGIILPLVLLCALGGIFCWQIERLRIADRKVRKCDLIIQEVGDVQKLLVDMETGLRAYIMTGQEVFLDPYKAADAQLKDKFTELESQVADDPVQSKTIAYLENRSQFWQFYASQTIDKARHNDSQVRSVEMTTRGKQAMDFIRTVIEKITGIETQNRNTLSLAAQRTASLVLATSISFSVLAAIILAVASRKMLFGVASAYTDALYRAEEREAEKTQLLASERTARSAAEHASRMKDEFLATLSHELRTPLNAILGWAHLLRQNNAVNSDLKNGLETIERNARMQTQLIEDLLDMSRIVSGKIRLDIQRVSPLAFIEPAVETITPAAEAKGIRIEKILDPQAGPISGDPARLQQVMWNLLSNAVKFTPRQGKIQVVLERVNSHIEITVADNGQGVDSDFLPFVFDKFRQADATSTRKHGGLGLGLSIVKQLIELHGGAVRVKSRGLGQGTTFTLELPVTVAHSDDAVRIHPTSPAAADANNQDKVLSGTRLLVVDDEPDARELIKKILEESGAQVVLASSATEGLEILQHEQLDALLSDIGMPDMDGYEFIKKVRAIATASQKPIPAIALTAFARSEDRTRSLLAGYQVHLSKPVEPAELLATVVSATGRTIPG